MKKIALLVLTLYFALLLKTGLAYYPPPNGTSIHVYSWSTEIEAGCYKGLNYSKVEVRCWPNTPCTCSALGESCTNYTGWYDWNPNYCLGTDSQWHAAYWHVWWGLIPNIYNLTVSSTISGYVPKTVKVDIRLYNSTYSAQCQSEDSYNTCYDCNTSSGGYWERCAANIGYTYIPSDTVYYLIGNRSDWESACSQLCTPINYTYQGFDLRNVFLAPIAGEYSVTVRTDKPYFWACLYYPNGTIVPDKYGYLRRCGSYSQAEVGFWGDIMWGGVNNGSYYFRVIVAGMQPYQSQVFTLPPSYYETVSFNPAAFTAQLSSDTTYVTSLGSPVSFSLVMGVGVPPYDGYISIVNENGINNVSFPAMQRYSNQQNLTVYSGYGPYELIYGVNYVRATIRDGTGQDYGSNPLYITVSRSQEVAPIPLVPNATDPIPSINATEWQSAGFGWFLPFTTPMFIYTLGYMIFATIAGVLSKGNLVVPAGIILVFLGLGTYFGFYATWLGIVLTLLAAFIFAYLMKNVIM